jgi:dihydrofolate synthase/folylpolyglutamate synthase
VITSISLDHMKYLGDTVAQIAFEKCGIIKRGGVTVSSPGQAAEALAVIETRCSEEANKLFIPAPPDIQRIEANGSDIRYRGLDVHVPLAGEHQAMNAVTALEAVRALELSSLDVPLGTAIRGIAKTRFVARFERIGGNPAVIIDGAHNPAKMAALGKALDLLGDVKIHAIIAMLESHDVEASIREVLPKCATVIATTLRDTPRGAVPAEVMREKAAAIHPHVSAKATPYEAFNEAIVRCEPGDIVLVCGSLYLAGEIRPLAIERL